MVRQLQLNFTPLQVSCDAIRLQTLPFKDAQQLRELRDEYRMRYAMPRRSDQIVALPLIPGLPPIGKEKIVSAVVQRTGHIVPMASNQIVTNPARTGGLRKAKQSVSSLAKSK
ncbi:hypothetical protein [Paraburkholderia saeva]|uniref:Uncharacterized protein n=1 Tax=Paraburkholderia saeva TaxID=2777537 RepID=A0A9N8X129_9BURK|nr:hypothetical protein [Paraburkholderia saeva]CAG4896987.1 hypothetical protein LMG31841_02396 [Paraburkholderia saeva]